MISASNISTRILLGFAVIIAIMVGMTVFSVSRINLVADHLNTINHVLAVKQRKTMKLRSNVHDRAVVLRDAVILQDPDQVNKAVTELEKLAKDYAEISVRMNKIIEESNSSDEQERAIHAKLREAQDRAEPIIERVIALRKVGNVAEAQRVLLTEASPAFKDWLRTINQFVAHEEEQTAEVEKKVHAGVTGFETLIGTICATAAVLAAGIAYACLLALRPLNVLTEIMGQVAADDLSNTIPYTDRKNEIGAIARAVQVFTDNAHQRRALEREAAERSRIALAEAEQVAHEQENASAAFGETLRRFLDGDLTARVEDDVSSAYVTIKRDLNAGLERVREFIAAIKHEMGSIRSSTSEIASSADDLSRRTEAQAANLEETAAAVEQITATVKATADGAAHARQVVSTTKLDAEQSGEVVGRAVEAMSAIEASSRQINQIISVIDEIAFQTNLLALNAGVEAARAGEAGRGFAVVATEVRALAQRSAEAARQIKDLISASTNQVSQGVELVDETGTALKRILAGVAEINELVAAIASGASEQSTGLAQINVAILQIDKITQQNAAMVEETSAAVRTLAGQAEEVATQSDRFRTATASHDEGPAKWMTAARQDTGAHKQASRKPRVQPSHLGAAAQTSAHQDDDWTEF